MIEIVSCEADELWPTLWNMEVWNLWSFLIAVFLFYCKPLVRFTFLVNSLMANHEFSEIYAQSLERRFTWFELNTPTLIIWRCIDWIIHVINLEIGNERLWFLCSAGYLFASLVLGFIVELSNVIVVIFRLAVVFCSWK